MLFLDESMYVRTFISSFLPFHEALTPPPPSHTRPHSRSRMQDLPNTPWQVYHTQTLHPSPNHPQCPRKFTPSAIFPAAPLPIPTLSSSAAAAAAVQPNPVQSLDAEEEVQEKEEEEEETAYHIINTSIHPSIPRRLTDSHSNSQ